MGISRRDFLMRVGQAGGYGAAFFAMQGMGLMPASAEALAPAPVDPGSGKGTKVLILGGGIAGLVSAYELGARGYDCTVLEARERPGGRNWTIRGGDKIVFMDGTTQTSIWNKGITRTSDLRGCPPFIEPCWVTAKSSAWSCRWR